MAGLDWSKLPTELLNLISQRIYEEVDLIHFRSVCSTWRSSSVPNHFHHILSFKFPLIKLPFLSDPNYIGTINSNNHPFCLLSKQNLFLMKPPQQEQEQEQTLLRPWLIRVIQNTHGQTQYFHPVIRNCSFFFHSVLDYNKLSVLHLGSTFFVKDFNEPNLREYMYPEKVVAVTCHGKEPLVVGTLASPPYPLLLKRGDENWKKVVPDMLMRFEDICVFKGRPYVVDEIGKGIMVGPDSSVQLVAEPLVGGGIRKLLVESEGDLLLADIYVYPVRVDLFKLNEKEKKWVKLTSLGDRVLFLGFVCSFSASASDLCVAKGNCVIFMDNIFEGNMISKCESYVLDLDQGRLFRLSNYPEYSDLFWPPSKYVTVILH